jgi:hypothetical protein
MNDFDRTLSAMFDEVAGTIQPRPNFDAVLAGGAQAAPALQRSPWARRSFRQGVGIAAATALVLGGSAFALGAAVSSDGPATLQDAPPSTDDVIEIVDTSGGDPSKTTLPSTSEPDGSEPDDTWPEPTEPTATEPTSTEPEPTEPSTIAPPVTTKPEPPTTTKPLPPPTTVPAPVAFTANLGESNLGGSPMVQWLYGTATPGSRIDAVSAYGSGSAIAGARGGYELKLKMFEVPAGTPVDIRVTNTASASVYEFTVTRPAPQPVEFTAQAAFTTCDSNPVFNEYWGRATAGSTISISSAYGSKVVTAGGEGHWEARVEFPGVPVGTTFMVIVTNSASGSVYEFPFTRVG